MVLTETGLAKVFQRIKSFVASQLNSKASAIHTHTSSDITDLPNGLTVDSTLDGTSSNAIANSAVKNALDGKISSEIDSMGTGWVRFKSGLQICWGRSSITWVTNENQITISFAKSFIGTATISLSHSRIGYSSSSFSQIRTASPSNFVVNYIARDSVAANPSGDLQWLAIGEWK